METRRPYAPILERVRRKNAGPTVVFSPDLLLPHAPYRVLVDQVGIRNFLTEHGVNESTIRNTTVALARKGKVGYGKVAGYSQVSYDEPRLYEIGLNIDQLFSKKAALTPIFWGKSKQQIVDNAFNHEAGHLLDAVSDPRLIVRGRIYKNVTSLLSLATAVFYAEYQVFSDQVTLADLQDLMNLSSLLLDGIVLYSGGKREAEDLQNQLRWLHHQNPAITPELKIKRIDSSGNLYFCVQICT